MPLVPHEPDAPGAPPDRLLDVVRLLGRPTAILLLKSGWIVRRKDAVELISDTWARMKSSVDVAIPTSLKPIRPAINDQPDYFAVPILLLPKVPPTLMKFRFRAGTDKLTLPTRRQNGLASYAALLWAARKVLGWPLPREIREQLLFVAVGPPEYAAPVGWRMRAPREGSPKLPALEGMPTLNAAEDELQRWCAQLEGKTAPAMPPLEPNPPIDPIALLTLNAELAEDELVAYLLRKLATNSVVMASVRRSPTGSQTISLTYDVNLYKPKTYVGSTYVAQQGWLAYELVFQTAFVGARSYHFEFQAPVGVEAIHAELRDQPLEDEWDPQQPAPPVASDKSLVDSDEEHPHSPDTSSEEDEQHLGAPDAPPTEDEQHSALPDTPPDVEHRAALDAPPDDDDDEHGRPEYDYVPIRGHRVHLYRAKDDVPDAVTSQLFVRVARERFAGPAFLASAAIAVMLTASAILTRPLVSHATGAQALLLLIPGVFTALISRVGEHALTIRMLEGARRTLLSSGVAAFAGAGFLTMIKTGDGAHASWWHRWIFIALALFATAQATKLWLARILPSHQAHGPWRALVERVRRREERKACRAAIRAQRAMKLRVTADDLTFDGAEKVAAASVAAECLPLRAGPKRRWFVGQDPALFIATEAEGEPLLMVAARPGDPFLMQEPAMQRKLAATIRWLDSALGTFRLEVRWMRRRDAIRYLLRNIPQIMAGKADLHRPVPVRPPREAAEVAAAARRGELRLHRVHVVKPPAAQDDAREATD